MRSLLKKIGSFEPKVSGVDLFCGAGGLTHGLVRGGVEITAGVDLDASCRFPYEKNNKTTFLERDLRQLHVKEIKPFFKENTFHLLAGCAPCQPFSKYSQKSQARGTDGKWDLLLSFGRLVKELQPEFVTMENVPQLLKHEIFEQFLKSLSGYHTWYEVIQCIEYGVPQTRKRLVLLASKLGPIELIPPTHSKDKPLTVRDVISKLPMISAGESHPSDPLHVSCSLSKLNLRRMKVSTPGGTWRDWPAHLRTKCHKKESGQTYSSVYGRMKWEEPAPTMTTQCFGYGNGRFGHPEQDRAISLREASLMQTFPENYQFTPDDKSINFHTVGRLIGNAVPVRIGEIVANSIMKHLRQYCLA